MIITTVIDPNAVSPMYKAWGPFLEAPGNYRAR